MSETTASAASITFVGVDVALKSVEVYIAATERRLTLDDPARLVVELKKCGPCRVIMEATGGYERRWAAALLDADILVAVVNPKRVRDFAKALGYLATPSMRRCWPNTAASSNRDRWRKCRKSRPNCKLWSTAADKCCRCGRWSRIGTRKPTPKRRGRVSTLSSTR